MAISKELQAFVEHFRNFSGMVDVDQLEETHLPHWKRIDLGLMNQVDLQRLTNYLQTYFPPHVGQLGPYEGRMYLTLDIRHIQNHIIKERKS